MARRSAALQAMADYDVSQRRACRLVGVDPKTVRRKRVPDCPEIRQRMRQIASERRRFGYRRIGQMLKREGITMNHKKLRRLYKEEGLSVRRRRGRKRPTGTRQPLIVPAGPGERWSLDFLADTFGEVRRFRILAVIDDFTRECLALIADTSISGARVARELDAVIRLYGRPRTIVSDNVLYTERCVNLVTKSHRVSFADTFDSCPSGFRRQEMISSIANTGYAVLRPSPSLRRDSKSQAKDPNIIYEVGSRLHGSHRERSFRLGRPFKEGAIGLAAFDDRVRAPRDLCGNSSISFASDMGIVPIMGDISLKLISKRIGPLHNSDLRGHPEGAPEARVSIF